MSAAGRSYQPELKICTTGLFFKAKDGTDMMIKVTEEMIKVTEDMTGKDIAHEVCSFNEFHDVRTCLDWEDKSTHRDMKDNSGNWQKIVDE